MRQSLASAIASTLDVPTIITDANGLVLASTAAESPDLSEITIGSSLRELATNFTDPAVADAIRESTETGVSVILELKNGGRFECMLHRAGHGVNMLYLWQDRVVRDHMKQLVLLGTTHVAMLGGFSHEARNPLHAILGYSECLLNPSAENLTVKQREYCNNILQSGKHLLWLCDQMLDFAKLQSGRVAMEVDPVDIHDLLETSILLVRERAERKDIEFIVDEPSEVMPTLFVDGRRIATVLVNLFSNAIRLTPRGGRVIVGVRFVGMDAFFLVSDNGVGISSDSQVKPLEPWFNSDEKGSSDPGSGIGLALAKKIVEMHGGDISLQCQPESGSLFIVRIPILTDAADALVSPALPTAAPGPQHKYHWGGIV